MSHLINPYRFPAPGGGGSATVTYVTVVDDASNASTYTFTAANIGAADADRTVVLAVSSRGNVGATIDSVTVGGVSATELVESVNGSTAIALYAIDVASGTTADIVVNLSAGHLRCGVGIWRCTGISTTPNDTDIGVGATLDGSVAATTGGAVIAAAATPVGVATFSWSGVTEVFDVRVAAEALTLSGASDEIASATTVNGSATPTTGAEIAAVYAAW